MTKAFQLMIITLLLVVALPQLKALPVAIFKYQAVRRIDPELHQLIAAAVYRQLAFNIGKENIDNQIGRYPELDTIYSKGGVECSHGVAFFIFQYRGSIMIEFQIFRLKEGTVWAKPDRRTLRVKVLENIEEEVRYFVKYEVVPTVE